MRLVNVVRRGARAARVGAVLSARLGARLYGGTDKVSHGYLPYYERHFRRRRYQRLVIIEIGVGGYESRTTGGSLRVWRDYFVRSTIVGVDIHEKDVQLGRRVCFVRADQTSATDLERVLAAADRAPDIIIDDGSHIGQDVRATFDFLFPRLAPGGVYVIEDLHTSYWPDYGGSSDPPSGTAVGLIRELIDCVQSRDATFARRPELGEGPRGRTEHVAGLSIYPGIAFIQRASR